MKQLINKLILSLLIFTIATPAYSAPTCKKLFDTRTFLQKASNLVIRNPELNPAPTKLLGLATQIQPRERKSIFSKAAYYVFDFIPNKLGHLITLDRSYTFTPFKAIDELVLDKPTRHVTDIFVGKKKEMGILLKLPLMVILSMAAINTFDQKVFWPAAEAKAAEQIYQTTQQNAPYFDRLIDTDFRFQQIKKQKNEDLTTARNVVYNGKNLQEYIEATPTVKSRFLAFGLKRSYEEYFRTYSNVESPRSLTVEDHQALFGLSPLFTHLNFFFDNGIQQYPGTLVSPQYQGPLSDIQKKHLYELTHLMYAKYLIVDVMFDGKTNIADLTAKNALARDMYNDPYTQKLLDLHSEGRITKQELIYFLHEDAQHTYYTSLFDSLHIVNLKQKNGRYTSEPLTLNDLRQDRINSIK